MPSVSHISCLFLFIFLFFSSLPPHFFRRPDLRPHSLKKEKDEFEIQAWPLSLEKSCV
jgi:hypothetical protein